MSHDLKETVQGLWSCLDYLAANPEEGVTLPDNIVDLIDDPEGYGVSFDGDVMLLVGLFRGMAMAEDRTVQEFFQYHQLPATRVKTREQQILDLAVATWNSDEVDVDLEEPQIHESEDNGVWVAGFLWVDFLDTELDKTKGPKP